MTRQSFKGTVVNRTLPSLHTELLKLTLTIPLKGLFANLGNWVQTAELVFKYLTKKDNVHLKLLVSLMRKNLLHSRLKSSLWAVSAEWESCHDIICCRSCSPVYFRHLHSKYKVSIPEIRILPYNFNLKNLSGGINLSRGLNMVGST